MNFGHSHALLLSKTENLGIQLRIHYYFYSSSVANYAKFRSLKTSEISNHFTEVGNTD